MNYGRVLCGIFMAGSAFMALPAHTEPEPAYIQLTSPDRLQDEIFYVLTLIEQNATVRKVFQEDPVLMDLTRQYAERFDASARACELAIEAVSQGKPLPAQAALCSPSVGRFAEDSRKTVAEAAGQIFDRSAEVREIVRAHVRASGFFQRHADMEDRDLFIHALQDAFAGIDRLVRIYGLGEAPRYADIDGPIYSVDGYYYRTLLANLIRDADSQSHSEDMVWGQPLSFALNLMKVNGRDDAVRQLTVQKVENRAAYTNAESLQWNDYPYAAILVPGQSPEVSFEPLNPNAKLRMHRAVELFKAGQAPLIIVSGGAIRPVGTTYTEALEMKRYLMAEYGVPEEAILCDTLARHTTTNLRNAARLLFRIGVGAKHKAVIVGDQVPYILSETFADRNMQELGYLPYSLHERIAFDVLEFSPSLLSLHKNATDPLDP